MNNKFKKSYNNIPNYYLYKFNNSEIHMNIASYLNGGTIIWRNFLYSARLHLDIWLYRQAPQSQKDYFPIPKI